MAIFSFELSRDEFCKRLGGGFPSGSIVLIEGGPGSGKSTISQRICYGFLDNNTNVTFISTQMTTKGFINQMYSLDYPIGPYLLKNKLLYIPVHPLVKASKSRVDFAERLMGAEELFKNDIIIIDTISSLIKHSVSSDEKGLELMSFFKKISGVGKTLILTMDPSDLSEDIRSIFSSSSDVFISLRVKALGNEIKRTAVVNKFTGARAPVGSMIGFRIEPNVGLVVEIATVS